MSIDLEHGYEELLEHAGHAITCVTYGGGEDPANVAIECETCDMVLLDFDRPEEPDVTA